MTSRIRDLTRPYDWYIYHGHINGKRTLQIESTNSRNGYNHKLCDIEILSFASMASRQGVLKHGFVSKIAGGCSSYDVIAP